MIATDLAPGVYYQTVDAGSPPVTPLRTDITGFVGIAERGPVDLPVPVESWQQFVSWFGGPTPVGYLALAVRGFLENGGRRCWVVRVASDDPNLGRASSSVTLPDAAGPVWRVTASSPGGWGDQLDLVVREVNRAQVQTTATDPDGRWCAVPRVAGFERATLVRLSQAGSPLVLLRTVAAVDAIEGRLHWVHPEPGAGLPYDAPVHGFDPNRPLLVTTVGYRVLVSERGRLLRVLDEVSTVPESPRYGPALLRPLAAPVDPVTGEGQVAAPEPVVVEELRSSTAALTALVVDPAVTLPLTGGRAGLSPLTVADFIGEPFAVDDDAETLLRKRRGLRALEQVAEIGLLAVPDILIHPEEPHATAPLPPCVPDPCLDEAVPTPVLVPETLPDLPPVFGPEGVFLVQSEMVLQCERLRDRFALLDPPLEVALDATAGIRGVLDWRSRFDTTFAALSYPWLVIADPNGAPGDLRLLPAAGHVAGLTAGTDLEVGVHKAPANRRVAWALGPSVAVDEQKHAVLNTAGVNVARSVGGRGLRLLGARTMSSDPDWRFLNVRRLMAMVEKAFGIALQWAVFEPNGFLTRARATMTATFFLDAMHEAGMLAGATPEESFFVRCDLDNNTAELRDLGQLVVEVGVAPAVPLEFVVLRVGRVHDSLEVRDLGVSLGATGTGV
jgi:phage tail sheath protein FI